MISGHNTHEQEWKHEHVVYVVPNPSRVIGSFVLTGKTLEVGGITESDSMERQTRAALHWVITQPDWEFVVCSSSDHKFNPDALQQWLKGRSTKNLMACEYRNGVPLMDAIVMSRDMAHRVLIDGEQSVFDVKPVPIRTHSWLIDDDVGRPVVSEKSV